MTWIFLYESPPDPIPPRQYLLDSISYPKKGIILDTGHLMNTNLNLKTYQESFSYIHWMLDLHQEIIPQIKGIHLHQSSSDKYVRSIQKIPPILTKNFLEDFKTSYDHVRKINTHSPMISPQARELIARIDPDYLVYELVASDIDQKRKQLHIQSQLWQNEDGDSLK